MIQRAKKAGNLITWLRSLAMGNREEASRHAFARMKAVMAQSARAANRDRFLELWCGVKVEK